MKKKTAKKPGLDQFKTKPIAKGSVANFPQLHPVLQKHLGYCLYKVALKFRGIVDASLADKNLIAPQFGILNVLRGSEGLNQIALGTQMGLDKATVVKLIDGLEKAGYVLRVASQSDRREKFLKITTQGIKFLDHIVPHMKELETEFLSPLTEAEKRALKTAIPKLMGCKKSEE